MESLSYTVHTALKLGLFHPPSDWWACTGSSPLQCRKEFLLLPFFSLLSDKYSVPLSPAEFKCCVLIAGPLSKSSRMKVSNANRQQQEHGKPQKWQYQDKPRSEWQWLSQWLLDALVLLQLRSAGSSWGGENHPIKLLISKRGWYYES